MNRAVVAVALAVVLVASLPFQTSADDLKSLRSELAEVIQKTFDEGKVQAVVAAVEGTDDDPSVVLYISFTSMQTMADLEALDTKDEKFDRNLLDSGFDAVLMETGEANGVIHFILRNLHTNEKIKAERPAKP